MSADKVLKILYIVCIPIAFLCYYFFDKVENNLQIAIYFVGVLCYCLLIGFNFVARVMHGKEKSKELYEIYRAPVLSVLKIYRVKVLGKINNLLNLLRLD